MASPKDHEPASELSADQRAHLRKLAHDLSNSLETILQASYLLSRSPLEGNTLKWAQLIETSSAEAARLNREIRELLRSGD
jgi:signal transduction histidine kinase